MKRKSGARKVFAATSQDKVSKSSKASSLTQAHLSTSSHVPAISAIITHHAQTLPAMQDTTSETGATT